MKASGLLLPFLLFTFFSCSNPNTQEPDTIKKDTTTTGEPALPEPQSVTGAAKKILSVTDTLFKGDTLKIKFKTPHPKDFAIVGPDTNSFFFVVYAASDPAMPSLVDWKEFANRDHLELITNKTRVNPWNANIKESQLVFTKTGKYELQLSENLETDDGTPVETETVYYFDQPKNNKPVTR